MQPTVYSALAKGMSGAVPNAAPRDNFTVLKRDSLSFRLVFESEEAGEYSFSVTELPACELFLYKVGGVEVDKKIADENDSWLINDGQPGFYEDVLYPLKNGIFNADKGINSLWIELKTSEATAAGKYTVAIVGKGEAELEAEAHIEVCDAVLPRQKVICTNWFHCDCLATQYNVEVFSEEHWLLMRNYIKFAVAHGINCILTPLFTPPLDTEIGGERPSVQLVGVKRRAYKYSFDFERLDRWVDMCLECGVEYFELSHLYTQWGAHNAPKIIAETTSGVQQIFGWSTKAASQGYQSFLRQFAEAFTQYAKQKGIAERCFFHVSDEPSLKDYFSYRRVARLTREYFSQFKQMDAMSEYIFCKSKLVDLPVACIDHYRNFHDKVEHRWCYYCCGPNGNDYINRFVFMPSLRNRALGLMLFKYDIEGFLHWGYNFWYTVLSKDRVNPYENCTAGGGFPAGDGFVVYPGEDYSPVASIRLKVFAAAFSDEGALELLAEKIGRQAALEFIEGELDRPLDFNCFPKEDEWLLDLRDRLNRLVAQK